MKIFFLLIACFLVTITQAQKSKKDKEPQEIVLPQVDGKIFFEFADSVDKSQVELYTNAKLWIVNMFRDSKEVIQLDDKETGEILGKGLFRFNYKYLATIYCVCRFTIKVSLREKKYRIQIYDLVAELGDNRTPYSMETVYANSNKIYNKRIIENVDQRVKEILEEGKTKIPSEGKDSF